MPMIAELPEPMTLGCLGCGGPVLHVDISEEPAPPPLCIDCTMATAPPDAREETAEELRFVWSFRKEAELPADTTMFTTVWAEEIPEGGGVLIIQSMWVAIESWPSDPGLAHWRTRPAAFDPPFLLTLVGFGGFLEGAPQAVYFARWRWREPEALPIIHNVMEPGVPTVDVTRLVAGCVPIAYPDIQHARGSWRPPGSTNWTKEEFRFELARTRQKLRTRFGRMPTNSQIAADMGIPESTFYRYRDKWLPKKPG